MPFLREIMTMLLKSGVDKYLLDVAVDEHQVPT
jgi:hypothetical protein